MHTTKASSGKYYLSPKAGLPSIKSSTFLKTQNRSEIVTAEDQQKRIRNLINEVRNGGILSPDAILISKSELNRIKSSTNFYTKEELIQQKRLLEEQNEKQQAAAKAKKQRMMEIEAEKRKMVPPTDIELEKLEYDEQLRERAVTLQDEEMDDVKHMNQMMLYAKVVTIRDKQLLEKDAIRKKNKQEERRRDLTLELGRLQKVQFYEELDRKNMAEQKKSAMATVEQMKERELKRQHEKEEREKEGQDMLKKIKEIQLEDSKTALEKKREQKELLDLIYEANKKVISQKQEKIILEKEEEERIVKYNKEKAQKEADYQREQERIKDMKEKEIIKLRKLQEKAADRQAEVDAIRAKRASEQADRLAREKEKRDAETKARQNRELNEVRYQQRLEKEHRLQEQARQERDEFERIVTNQKFERELEVRNENEKALRVVDHANQLKKQIAINEEKKKQASRELLEEGRKIKEKLANEKGKLENIKSAKLAQLSTYDIPVKYTSELARKKMAF